MDEFMRQSESRRNADAERYKALDWDTCMLCGATGPDKRSLRIDCFYDISEVVPEIIKTANIPNEPKGFFLRICKACRGELLNHLGQWRAEMVTKRGLSMDHDGNLNDNDPERNIPMRVNGATVMMTRAEYDDYTRG